MLNTNARLLLFDVKNGAFVTMPLVKRANPNVSFPKSPSPEDLSPFGIVVVQPTPQPDGDVVTEGWPEKHENGEWYQTWEVRAFTEEELAEQLEDAKEKKRWEINAERDAAFDTGLPYDIAGVPDVVQTRLEDKVNLLGLRVEARELEAEGVTDAVMPFRGLNNIERLLTPTEMVAMTNAALAYIQGVYKKSWDLKDAVSDAATIAELEAIEW